MASACVNSVGILPENFLECPPLYPSYNWFGSKISFSREVADNGASKNGDIENLELGLTKVDTSRKLETEGAACDSVDFEFRLEDPVAKMLPADELFSDGKLVPLQFALARADVDCTPKVPACLLAEPIKAHRRVEIAGSDDLQEFSPKAPKCSSRWKELLGLKKVQSPKHALQKSTLVSSMTDNAKSLKHFLHRTRKSSMSSDCSLSLPLLRDSDSESVSISSRLSLSSSSSGADHEDFPRLSFDFEKPRPIQTSPSPLLQNHPRVRFTKLKSSALEGNVTLRDGRNRTRRLADPGDVPPPRGASVDSPRLNASGKVIFKGLERSSSSPSTFNGGPRPRPRGMERSYSANVRVTPVLNVPVCTLRGSAMSVSVFRFGQLFLPQKKEKKCFNCSSNGFSGTKVKNEKSDF